MQIQQVGEFALIDRIVRQLSARDPAVLTGPGDDAAVIRPSPDAFIVATCDTQVEGRHFRRDHLTPEQIGRRLAAVNLSDIAAMGARPRWALASFTLPENTETVFVERCVRGLAGELGTFGAEVVGGNLTGGAELVLDLTLLGETSLRPIGRDMARVGDAILLTGALGAATAGRLALEQGLSGAEAEACAARHRVPEPRVAAGLAIAVAGSAHAMIDISDGLAQDLLHVCDASNVGAVLDVDALPISAATRSVAAMLDRDATELALSGGEDYELLLTVPQADAVGLIDAVEQAGSIAVTRIGTIVPLSEGRWLQHSQGRRAPLERSGWQHFGSHARSER